MLDSTLPPSSEYQLREYLSENGVHHSSTIAEMCSINANRGDMISHNCSIKDFKESVFPTAYLLVFILGLVGHLVSMYVFFRVWRKKRYLTTVNQFMVNLLVSDLMLVCSLPFRASYYLSGSTWIFGPVACRLLFYIFYLNMYTSIYFLVSLNIMRYLALIQPYRYKHLQKWCNGHLVCLLIWLFVALTSSPLLLLRRHTNSSTDIAQQCMELRNSNQTIQHLIIMNNATLSVGFLLPLVCILWCSVFVAYRLWKPGPSQRRVDISRKKAFALVIISLSFFIICFLPYHVMRTVFLHTELDVSNNKIGDSCETLWQVRKAAVVTLCLCVSHSCLDPILFFFVGENFRTFFAKLLRKKKTHTDNKKRIQKGAELQNLQK
ncbi:cysteinyl leukotriene receptor 2 isoform X1 [Ictalurus furcatus]|uniref:cysteinyl leukotriene receptor 2 isoform X1 n=2 Tax=Ictalurus furcatus TaxID=66913 RepID=UPI00234FCCC2|nr:cysteinyl leukotriene receptor 2 isoform X1 [Ictalurus furcatus]XP_053505609.1 cysteinyl leukotriene receptor 2 isoform X1 [Ictalurus furcatus]XP_053505611.1 cysteinyl leukotriene receptor 2 isoform X1 [Ictalurus furcatus]